MYSVLERSFLSLHFTYWHDSDDIIMPKEISCVAMISFCNLIGTTRFRNSSDLFYTEQYPFPFLHRPGGLWQTTALLPSTDRRLFSVFLCYVTSITQNIKWRVHKR